MPQTPEGRISFSFSFTQHASPTQSVVLQGRHFHHALLSGRRKDAKSNGSTEEVPLINEDCLIVNHEGANSDKLTFSSDVKSVVKLSRKYRMKDKCGNVVPQKRSAKASISITGSSCLKWKVMKGFNKVTLNVRSLKVGTFQKIYSGPVTFSLEYIEFANQVQLDVSEVIRCEWCTAHGLPALFLQTTAASCSRLRNQLSMPTDIEAEYDSSKNVEFKKVTFVFENEPTVLEKVTLQEMFMEIGRLKNMNNFLVKLTIEEANDKLKAVQQTHKMRSEMATVPRVSKSDDDEWMDCTSYRTQPAKILVVYPPPPAKGGFSITEEDIACLDEGEFLNDVIIDFYLKYLVCERLQKEDANRCHVFSSFFFKSLTHEELTDLSSTTDLSTKERRHNRVKTWTRHLDLFEKDFIFVPINQASHWYLAVICFPGKASQLSIADHCFNYTNEESLEFTPSPSLPNPMSLFYRSTSSDRLSKWSSSKGDPDDGFCFVSDDDMEDEVQYKGTTKRDVLGSIPSKQFCILIMDSLSCSSKPAVVQVLQEYLEMEWWVKKGSVQSFGKGAMKGWSLQVPQQDNFTDCGLFLLQYVESFITNPPQLFHHAMDLSGWFPLKLVKKKRERMKRLIYKLHHQQHTYIGD
ncbi:sentrin-specific protease 7 isoform X2 [Trichomycterus rosablanca]|uniref:sentrin-specific protease 7 isoform X2 n=1 Tax=Trichomycterus rosablanca TaxID=2290929 RepID=UPI002F35E9EF